MDDLTPADRLFEFNNTYANELVGLYVDWTPAETTSPRLVAFNPDLAILLRIAPEHQGPLLTEILSGNSVPVGAQPLAQAYAGHQFGGLSPQLGDGRAVLLGEVTGRDGRRYDIQLKGSGRTPFSRNGDGLAALGPMLREFLISEAMHALGIPTTRALAVVATGSFVQRERPLPGAILTRIASSHIRVGTFQFFALRQDQEKLQRLADYSIRRHYPGLLERKRQQDELYLAFFEAVLEDQAALIAKWMLIGFVHGVMNTDNMAISGETIDYGPCAFIDAYDAHAVFSSIDHGGRYAYLNQPTIAQWNLARFAEALMPLIPDGNSESSRQLTEVLHTFPSRYQAYWLDGMRKKLGLMSDDNSDIDLANTLYEALQNQSVDFTIFFRALGSAVRGDPSKARNLFSEPAVFDAWSERYVHRQELESVGPDVRANAMDRANPIYIPRNHLVEAALNAAVDGEDFAPFETLHSVLQSPFDQQDGYDAFAQPAQANSAPYVTYCGT